MTGRHSATGPDQEPRDAAVEERLQDYGRRWRTATAVLDEDAGRSDLDVVMLGAGHRQGRRTARDTVLVLVAVAASVAVVIGIGVGISSLTRPAPTSGALGSATVVPPTTQPTAEASAATSGKLGISFAPSGPVTGATTVTVTVTGFNPSAPVAVGVCPAHREVVGPGDCGRSKNLASRLLTIGADGTATATIVIPVGPLENVTPPSATCGPQDPCVMSAADISHPTSAVAVPIVYAR